MFSYIDKEIRDKLETDKHLVNLSADGIPVKKGDSAEPVLSVIGPIPVPRLIAGREVKMSWYAFVRRVQLRKVLDSAAQVTSAGSEEFRELLQANMSVNSILAMPNFLNHENPLVRVHSCCMTGDVFGSLRCECGPQLDTAFEKIMEEDGAGAVVYMSGHEGRGIGLWAKAITYLLQDDGQDTYQANTSLGLPEDSRDFNDAGIALRYLLEGKPVRLMSNNPLKKEHLENAGQPVSSMETHLTGVCSHNQRYMKSKREKGHQLPEI